MAPNRRDPSNGTLRSTKTGDSSPVMACQTQTSPAGGITLNEDRGFLPGDGPTVTFRREI